MTIDVVCGVIFDARGNILITQRSPTGTHPLDWEFPGGKRETNETLIEALKRELKEEINIACQNPEPYLINEHQYPDYCIRLHVYLVKYYQGTVNINENQVRYAWVPIHKLNDYRFPKANLVIIERLLEDKTLMSLAD